MQSSHLDYKEFCYLWTVIVTADVYIANQNTGQTSTYIHKLIRTKPCGFENQLLKPHQREAEESQVVKCQILNEHVQRK